AVADVDLERVLLVLERAPVERHVRGGLLRGRGPVRDPGAVALGAGVELALHEDELLVRVRTPAALRVHDEGHVHALHDVHQHGRRAAVHHVGAGGTRDELDLHLFALHYRPERDYHVGAGVGAWTRDSLMR